MKKISISGLHLFPHSQHPIIKENINLLIKKSKITTMALNIVFVPTKRIRTLNYRWKNKNKDTNVLTFPIKNSFININSRGIIILPINNDQQSIRHITISLIHGLLHLLGFNHHKNALFAKHQLLTELLCLEYTKNF